MVSEASKRSKGDETTRADDPRISSFAELVERYGLHGLAFQHLSLCDRRAWLHLHRIDYAHMEERMKRGTVAHNLAKRRDSSVTGLMGLSPDRIDWEGRCVIEAKHGPGAENAVAMQTAFYALLLAAATGERWRAKNEILSQRRHRPVAIDDDTIDNMLALARRAASLFEQEYAPAASRKPICGSCSYRYLCGYS